MVPPGVDGGEMAGEMMDSGRAGVTLALASSFPRALPRRLRWLVISCESCGVTDEESALTGLSSARPSIGTFGRRGCGAMYGDLSAMVRKANPAKSINYRRRVRLR